MLTRKNLLIALLVVAVAIFAIIHGQKRVDLPAHLLGHPSIFMEDLLTESEASQLLALAKEMGSFPCNTADLKFYTTKHEHIGEAEPIGSDGKCAHPYLVPDSTRELCVLPGRIDIGRHYIKAGGVQGLKEPYEDVVARLLSFGRYIFDYSEYDVVKELFNSDSFQAAAKAVCPADKQVLDPFQFNFIVQVPGQTVALHVDGVYFWGATRFQFPQWLLAVMQFSGIFQDDFIDQIQVVGYFHEWEDLNNTRGGQFVYWDNDDQLPHRVPPLPRAGSVVDGSKTVHAATVYQPEKKAPKIDKSNENTLNYVGDDKWEVRSNGELVQEYVTDDLRWTIVYRARCFESEEKKALFHNFPEDKEMQLEQIIEKLKSHLVRIRPYRKSVGYTLKRLDDMSRLDLALTFMDEFIKYPLPPTAIIPYNYCAAMKQWPWTKIFLQPFCN